MPFRTRAAVLRGHDATYSLEDVQLSDLRSGEVRVRVVGAGMCHTDLLLRRAGSFARIGPVVLGHEGAGIVEETGPGVTGVRVGDHVCLTFDSCGRCRCCLLGAPAHCREFELRNSSGHRPDGTAGATDSDGSPVAARWFGQSSFSGHAIATERNVVVVDSQVPLDLVGPLGCGIQTGAGSVLNEMKLAPGQSIAIFGAGAVGLAGVMAAKLAGAREIAVVDLHEARLEAAQALGATRVVRGDTPDLPAQVRGRGSGFDFSLETTASPRVMSAAITCLTRPGKAVLVGAGGGELTLQPGMLAGRHVTFALEGGVVPQVFIPELLAFWRQGIFPFDTLIKTYALTDIDQAEKDSLAGETIKPVLVPH